MEEYSVVRRTWDESERGWGVRPDGHSLHLTEADCESYIEDYWAKMPDSAPDEYSRPNGVSTIALVDKDTYDKIVASKNGIRKF